ncbi:signal peptidase I [Enterococcus pallens]|uniref:Signal peptidase I n=1 Tax=Enterococcus pallens ATCC BAA-351 TaxID=1158607 RepID=R2T1P6_9ENTE|nr:signal peptidase I [Enterococcus pallens]EOH94204.1 signal peptidase I [Enterococcus pallens ATCC BAA-351]EOU24083.1 signal peptidase I [Enterococcus pallens ATCC BAA-351]OJG82143.1 signal peptidase I [Enterococcus pallens]
MTRAREYRPRDRQENRQMPDHPPSSSDRRTSRNDDYWNNSRPVRDHDGPRPPNEDSYQRNRYSRQRSPDYRKTAYRQGPSRQYRPPHPGRSQPVYARYDQEWPAPRPRPSPRKHANNLQKAKQSTHRQIFLFIYNLFFYTLTIGILLSSVMFAFSEKSNAAILGHRFYQVLTDSMAPQPNSPKGGFYSGDIVLVKMTDGSQVKPGDIVTFQVGEGDRYLTHRMVERLDQLNGQAGDYIVTKGDANKSNDPPILADRVRGKVVFVIPKMGSLLNFIQENLWLCVVCVLSTFGFFLVLKAYFLQPDPVRESTKRKKYPREV